MNQPCRSGPALLAVLVVGLVATSCFKENEKPKAPEKEAATEVSGELFKVAQARGLKPEQVSAALKTYVPSGGRDEHIGMMAAGSSGRLIVFGIPSMRILKYVGVFTPEPWQGFAYDDESRDLLLRSARENIEYTFGDSGLPAFSEKNGMYDGKALFMADGANGRVAVLHLDDYETKQVVTNPFFRTSFGAVAVTPDTDYIVQNTSGPEIPGGVWADPAQAEFAQKLRGGLTLWKFKRGGHTENRIDEAGSFTVELPPYVQGESDAGKAASAGQVFTLGFCRGEGVVPGVDTTCGEQATPGVLHIVDVQKAASLAGTSKVKVGAHGLVSLADAAQGALRQVALPAGPTTLAVSPDGTQLVVTHDFGDSVSVLDLAKLKNADWSGAAKDAFGVPTLTAEQAGLRSVKVGGPSADASFAAGGRLYVSVNQPGKLVRVDLGSGAVQAEHALGFDGGKLLISQGETAEPLGDFAVVMNLKTADRMVSIGPVPNLNPHLLDISGEEIEPLYDMSIPQATRLEAVAIKRERVEEHAVMRYPVGTDTRSNELSEFRTAPGEERVERRGNRVHVFGTLIRSHLNPEIVEVEEGDVVTFHLTNLEQAQDQTHGFTVSTYNVHSSWEPGKVASVTFTADKQGVYPYYCTEFCSALHLEMMGYLLVKPKGFKDDGSESAGLSPEELEKARLEYEAKVKSIAETQAVIDSVVTWLKENNYQKDKRAADLVDDAVSQLGQAAEVQKRIDAAVQAKDWPQAKLWAEQYFQYQVKAADAGVRAKNILSEGGK